jgi:hypothetical protein
MRPTYLGPRCRLLCHALEPVVRRVHGHALDQAALQEAEQGIGAGQPACLWQVPQKAPWTPSACLAEYLFMNNKASSDCVLNKRAGDGCCHSCVQLLQN